MTKESMKDIVNLVQPKNEEPILCNKTLDDLYREVKQYQILVKKLKINFEKKIQDLEIKVLRLIK